MDNLIYQQFTLWCSYTILSPQIAFLKMKKNPTHFPSEYFKAYSACASWHWVSLSARFRTRGSDPTHCGCLWSPDQVSQKKGSNPVTFKIVRNNLVMTGLIFRLLFALPSKINSDCIRHQPTTFPSSSGGVDILSPAKFQFRRPSFWVKEVWFTDISDKAEGLHVDFLFYLHQCMLYYSCSPILIEVQCDLQQRHSFLSLKLIAEPHHNQETLFTWDLFPVHLLSCHPLFKPSFLLDLDSFSLSTSSGSSRLAQVRSQTGDPARLPEGTLYPARTYWIAQRLCCVSIWGTESKNKWIYIYV